MNIKNCTKCGFQGNEVLFVKQKVISGHKFLNRCKKCDSNRVKKSKLNNPEKHKEWENKSKLRPQYKAMHQEYSRHYKSTNKAKVNARNRCRNKRVRQATPQWISNQQRSDMISFYLNRPVGYHVDHMVPIKGVDENNNHVVCGLHVPWNLQYLIEEENLIKNNQFNSS